MAQNSKKFKARHNEAFNADSATVMHSEDSFVIDFKQTTPRLDQIDGDVQHTLVAEHDPVVLNPHMAKVLLNILQENIANYEEKFGEIRMDDEEDEPPETPDTHEYIG